MDDQRMSTSPIVDDASRKVGANYVEENEIRRLHREGLSPEQIAAETVIQVACVKSVLEDYLANHERYDTASAESVAQPVRSAIAEPSEQEIFGELGERKE